ncbi:MAG: hypothetical protein MZV64_29440 [Ignavibacteriales bacterium]|nr:hypothetical protein [Ignavibacteriales bacterium]
MEKNLPNNVLFNKLVSYSNSLISFRKSSERKKRLMNNFIIIIALIIPTANAQDAKEIVQKADELMRSNSSYSELKDDNRKT